MFALFPSLRSESSNKHGVMVSSRCTTICRVLDCAEGPISVLELQARLLQANEEWAAGHAGYLAVWTLIRELKQVGVVIASRTRGVHLASPDVLADIFTDALVNMIQESVPDMRGLGAFRDDAINAVLRQSVRTRAEWWNRGRGLAG